VQQPSEDCDDGNANNGDGCSNSCELETCEVLVDKQVSCDGTTWLDATLVLNNEDGTNGPGTGAASPCTEGNPVFVRYVARNTGDLAAICTLDESSSVIEPSVDGVVLADFEIDAGDTTDPVTPSGAPICDASLTAQEPNTITLSCECARLNGDPLIATATDTATIACEGNFAGCTPGFWKQPHHLQFWCDDFAPTDLVFQVFGVPQTANNNKSLLKALQTGGGGEIAMLRHAVAALLNSCNDEVNFFFSPEEVIDLVQEAYASGDFELAHGLFAAQNELECTVDKSNAVRETGTRGRSQLNKGDR
jgi:cysteine-rich repeat protein